MEDQPTRTMPQKSTSITHSQAPNGWWVLTLENLMLESKFSKTKTKSALSAMVGKIRHHSTLIPASQRQGVVACGKMIHQ